MTDWAQVERAIRGARAYEAEALGIPCVTAVDTDVWLHVVVRAQRPSRHDLASLEELADEVRAVAGDAVEFLVVQE